MDYTFPTPSHHSLTNPPSGRTIGATSISVTVLRNGTILSARITRRSGLHAMDRSIESVLRDVKQLPPFPENSRDEQRTFIIEFNLQAKRRISE